ncbi:hypothetical protein N8546_00900 [bacterium]|nr:hypothetical protein [bacterium]
MNRTIRNIGVLATVAIVLGQADLARAADANPPERMTYQGYLVDGNGAALAPDVPANYDIVFRIYNVKSGGVALWAEQQTVTVDKGYFSVLLGEGATTATGEPKDKLSEAFKGADISDRFIGITVGGLSGSGVDVEIAPRLRLVTSPFAFTATQATRLTDGAGNSNFFKEGASLKLGAGSTPTLTLPEAGGASLDGKLIINLSGYEVGLEINNGGSSTTLGAENTSHFHFKTDRGGFYFNKELRVFGNIHSQNADTILGPSNNTDTYLQVYDDSSDKIMARADQFLVQGDNYYLQMKFSSNQVDLETNASKFNMNKPLTVNGALTVSGLTLNGWIGRTAHNNGGLMGAYNQLSGGAKASNPIYILGSNYKPNQTTLGNMYGVGYTDWTASFITGHGSGWGFYVAADGDARTWLSGTSGAVSYINKNGGKVGIGTDTPSTTLDVGGAINATGNVTRNGQPLVRVDVIAEDKVPSTSGIHQGGEAVRSGNFTVTGDPVMLFISGSNYTGSVGFTYLEVKVYDTASPYPVVDTFKIRQYHNHTSSHGAFAPINRKIKNLVRGKSYFLQIRESTNAYFDIGDPFHIVVTQYNNQ